MLLNTVFKLNIYPKVCTFKNMEEISQKPVAPCVLLYVKIVNQGYIIHFGVSENHKYMNINHLNINLVVKLYNFFNQLIFL